MQGGGGATCANSPIFLHQEMGDVRVVPTQKRYVLCTHQRIEKANSAAEPPPFHRTVKIKDFHLMKMKHFKANLSAIERSNMYRFPVVVTCTYLRVRYHVQR